MPTQKRLYYLDIFRIISALVVILFHNRMHLNINWGFFDNFIGIGHIFMLSGFSLYYVSKAKEINTADNITGFLKKKIVTNKYYPISMHLQGAYIDLDFKEGDFPVAEKISRTQLSLTMFYGMTDEQIDYVIDSINSWNAQ